MEKMIEIYTYMCVYTYVHYKSTQTHVEHIDKTKERNRHTTIMGDFNISLLVMNRTIRQKIFEDTDLTLSIKWTY